MAKQVNLPKGIISPEELNSMLRCYVNYIHPSKLVHLFIQPMSSLFYYSIDTYRVYTLDVHKTKDHFHTNVTITDGTTTSGHGIKIGQWIQRDHLNVIVCIDLFKT
jgi:hypothetical protein